MNLAVDHPAVLLLLPLALLPLAATMLAVSGHPSLAAVPRDCLSIATDAALRLAGVAAIAAIILGLAGIHRLEQMIERESRGAHIVLLIDRSSSMDNSFADRRPTGEEESKSAAAKRLIADFVARRPHDRVGIVAFSTSPIPVLPLTDHHEAVQAAVAVIDRPGLAFTDVGRGLFFAMSMAEEGAAAASRAVVLVSDGAAVIDRRVQAALRDAATRSPFNLSLKSMSRQGHSRANGENRSGRAKRSNCDVRLCEGFSDAGRRYARPTHGTGVREATVHEVALAQVVQRARGATRRALWGLSIAAAARSVGSDGRMRVRAVVRGAAGASMQQPGRLGRAPISRGEAYATSRGRARWLPVSDPDS